MFVTSGASVKLAQRVPQAGLISGSLALVGLGIALLLALGTHSSWWAAEPGLLVAGAGAGVFNAVGSELALSSAPERHAGLASGINDTFRQGGLPLGVAVYGTLVPASGAMGRGPATAFVVGFHHALILASLIAFAGALTGLRLLGQRRRRVAELAPEVG